METVTRTEPSLSVDPSGECYSLEPSRECYTPAPSSSTPGWLLLLALSHELFERFDPAGAHEVETLLPEGLVARVDACETKDLGGGHGAACLEDAVVDGFELLALLQVLLVQRQDNKLREVVGVDVEGP